MTTHIGTCLAGEIHCGPFKILGTPPLTRYFSQHLDTLVHYIQPDTTRKNQEKETYSPGRYPGTDAGQPLRVIQQRGVHLGLDVPGRDGIHRDPLSGPLVGEALGELADGALGRGIGRDGEAALEGEQRGKVDDGPPAPRHG